MNAATADEPGRGFAGPVMAGFCGMLIGVGLGRFGYPPVIPAMVEAGWAEPTTLHLAGAFSLAGYVVGAFGAVPLARRLGFRPAVALVAIAAFAAFALSAMPLPPPLFIALRTLSGMTGGIFMIVLPPVVANTVAPRARGRANGLAFAGVGTGFMLSGTAVPLLASAGPAAAWLGLAAVIAIAAAAMMLALPRSPPPRAEARAQETGSVAAWRLRPTYLGLAAAYSAGAAGYVPHTIFFVDYVARDLGHGLAAGGWIWAVAGATAAVAPMVGGFAADRFGFAPALRIVLALMALGGVLPALTSHFALLMLSGMLCSGLMIALGSLAAGRTREIVGAEAHTRAWAVQTILFSILQAAAAYVFTALIAAGSGYPVIFALAGAIMALGLALELVASRRG